MTKSRTYGEQVRVRLYSQDGLTPFVIDFDSIDIEELSKNRINRAIGKKVSGHQRYGNDGWRITLTRSKRDNYLQSLFHYNEMHLQKGLDAPKFSVEHITTHTYNVANINPYLEFTVDNALKTTIVNSFDNLFKTPTLPAPIKKVTDSIQAVATVGANTLLGNFRERFIYHDCTITPLSSSDKPKENNVETITLYAVSRTDDSDNNLYTDSYLSNNMHNSLIKQIENDDNKPITDPIYSFGKQLNSNIQSFQNSISEKLNIIYDNLKTIL